MDGKINEIRSANDIVDVISSYIPLEKKGKNFFGVCPFHDDSNPSMSVSKDKQIYKCFSCGASGNVFNFVMDYEHVDFKEALSILAKKAGITLNNVNVKSKENKYDKYYKMYDISLKLYQNNLSSNLGTSAKEYLHKRGITDELIKTFKIGLATTSKDSLTKILNSKDYTNREIELYGLGTGTNDLYINRIMFPLFDISNNIVGFSGRIYNTSSSSKYINTKETPIFKKGELLYNYYNAKDSVRLLKKIVLVEGFMDVIRLHSINVTNAVALMGTSLTKEQINLLKRLSLNITLCLDGDSAGRKAMSVNGALLEEAGFNVTVVELPDNLDPDEYILKNGKDSYMALLDNAIAYSDYKINYLKEGKNLLSVEEQTVYINSVIDEISKEKDVIKQELLLNKLSKEFNLDVEILKNKLQNKEKCSKIETLNKEPIKKQKLDKYQKATYLILYTMLNSYDAVIKYEKQLNYLPTRPARYLANEIIYYYKKNQSLVLADFMSTLQDKEEMDTMLKEVLSYVFLDEVNLNAMDEYISVIKGYNSNRATKRLMEQLRNEPDPVKKALIAEQIKRVKIGS